MEHKVTPKQGKTIKLKPVTAERLDKLKHKGQSWDGIIAELIDHFEKKRVEGKSVEG